MVWKASWIGGYAGLPSVEHLSLFRHHFADGDLVRKRRHEYFGYASVYSPAVCGGRSGLEAKSDWEIYKAIAKKFSEVCVGHLGKETDIVTLPIQHDSAAELAQPLDVKDWKKGECDLSR